MKRAFVTGASRGIGKALVEELAAEDYYVFAGMRSLADSKFTQENIQPVQLDVLNDDSITHAMKVVAEQGTLEVLINNAGTNNDTTQGGKKEHLTTLSEVKRDSMLAMLNLNTVSPLIVTKAFVPLMTTEDSFIVNISSDRASFSTPDNKGNYGYRSSKVGLNIITQGLTYDLPNNIRTFAIHPGHVLTDLNPIHGVITPAESAKNIIAILDKWQPWMNGTFLNEDGTRFPL